MMSSYPIFLQPTRFERIKEALPPLPPQPRKPKLIKKNWLESLILWAEDQEDEMINAQRMMRYNIKHQQYQEEVKRALSDTEVRIFRQRERDDFLRQASRGTQLLRDVKKGRYEQMFGDVLRGAFGGKIHTDIEFELPNGNGYVPDFAYVDEATGLCIDIEIDEPYSMPEKQPIHFVGEDDYRNCYFMDNGWFIVRFAEEQIANQPNACLGYIRSVIDNILQNSEVNVTPVPVSRWDYFDAKRYAAFDYRNTY